MVKILAKWPKMAPVSLVGALLFFGLLWRLDLPRPMVDDLFYCGAGLHMAAGGDFSNPLLERQHFPSHFFFVYPPFQSYALWGWLSLFGVSAFALTGFQIANYCCIAAATVHLLRQQQAPGFLAWLVPIGVAAAMLPGGLRPEPFSLALIMVGLALVMQTSWSAWKALLGFFLLCLGAATAPRMTLFGASLGGFGCYHLLKLRQATAKPFWPVWVLGMVALAATVLVFLWMIHFRLEEFLRTFHVHAAGRVGELGMARNLKRFFSTTLGVTFWPVVFLVPLLGLLALRQPRSQLTWLGFALVGTFPFVVLIGGLGFCTAWFGVLALFCLAKSVHDRVSRRQAIFLQWTTVLAVLLSAAKPLMNVAGLLSGAIDNDLGEQREAALALRATPDHPVLVDEHLARRLFDYKLPEGFLDINFSTPFPGAFISGGLIAGDIYLIGTPAFDALRHDTFLEAEPAPRWNPLSVGRWSFERSPYRIHIVLPEQCKATRPEVLRAWKTP